jgi:hypothetical protein
MPNLITEAALRLHELLDYVEAGGESIDFTSRSEIIEILDQTDCMVEVENGLYPLVDAMIAMHKAAMEVLDPKI